MASSRKSVPPNKRVALQNAFQRALEDFLARVAVSGTRIVGHCSDPATVNVAIAFSGGLDSSLLLHLAQECVTLASGASLRWHVFHVHHGLSPNADAWEAHCAATAIGLGMPYQSVRVDVPHDSGGGIEQAARELRYAALGELCRQQQIPLILTAHHADDQAETVLMQALRGSGLPGLAGMSVFQARHALLGPSVALGRPLLSFSRRALALALQEYGVAYVHDESNDDPAYRRNAVRHRLAPVLESIAPGYVPALLRTAQHAQHASTLLDDLAQIDLAQCAADHDSALSVSALRALSPERASNLLRFWLHRQGLQYPSASRLEDLRRQALGAADDRQPRVLLGTHQLIRAGETLFLRPVVETPPVTDVLLQWRGEAVVDVPQWRGKLHFDEVSDRGVSREMLLHRTLRLLPRVGHERLRTGIHRPSRSLKNLFQEAAIPAWRRPWCPLFYLDDEMLGAAELGMDVRHQCAGHGVVLRWESAVC